MHFNEDTRVKIPAILHLTRLGYKYLSIKNKLNVYDKTNNIFDNIFISSLMNINPNVNVDEIKKLLDDIKQTTRNTDLGYAFYNRIIDNSINNNNLKIIDFENFERNTFNVVTELPYKKDNNSDEFRPDITLLINGLPLAFIEVKIPNNKNGIIEERKRMDARLINKDFTSFFNATQIMVFSNNQEYEDDVISPLNGSFYSTTARNSDNFKLNYFREEEMPKLKTKIVDKVEDEILEDNNEQIIKHNSEFQTNKEENNPTNKILTSLFNQERLSFLLKYGIAYIKDSEDKILEKHIMRYPQVFATKSIYKTLKKGGKKGIIWHTQGSGKTALVFYNIKYLTDFYAKENKIPKFYFIVDRIDLLNQAKEEFIKRGLVVQIIESRKEFARKIKETHTIHNDEGKLEITIVNIQRFDEDKNINFANVYDTKIQRIFFIDEVHRSYDKYGSNLANLLEADKKAVHIGLTGTPLISKNKKSKEIFGDYIHKYYYNQSISDGYTLRLIREDIETYYKENLEKEIENIKTKENALKLKDIFEHKNFIKPMLEYIIKDFANTRLRTEEEIGCMVICQSAKQARLLNDYFNNRDKSTDIKTAPKLAALILHDEGTKRERDKFVLKFKKGGIDLLFVYNMLLTGFDSPRLKKLYLTRVIKQHNLLQALTRANRPYQNFKYGYVVDFADISDEFDKTNRAYNEELKSEFGDDFENNSMFFKSNNEIKDELQEAKTILKEYQLYNKEEFRKQIDQIRNVKSLNKVLEALLTIKNLYNTMRSNGLDYIKKKLNLNYETMKNYKDLLNVVKKCIDSIKLKNYLKNSEKNFLNYAIEDVIFSFSKEGEEELILNDKYVSNIRKTRDEFNKNIVHNEPKFISLKDALRKILLDINESPEPNHKLYNKKINGLYEQMKELNHRNQLIACLYNEDAKFVRVYKNILNHKDISNHEKERLQTQNFHILLNKIKKDIDNEVKQNKNILSSSIFEQKIEKSVFGRFEKSKYKSIIKQRNFGDSIVSFILKEYKDSM